MKKMIIVLLAMASVFTATAQRNVHIVRPHYRPRVVVGVGYGYYSPFYPYPYSPFYPAYGYGYRPSRLDFQIQEIKNDYRAMIRDARQDKSMSRKDRRAKINTLKHDRDEAIIQAQKDYYKRRSR